ncbi:MAG: ribosome maturation factor RimM [Armatimonadota bacterium]|nr:ribosome maturation factor RimM [bacterium]
MPEDTRDIVIGNIVAPFGVKGELKVMLRTDFPERFDKGREVTVKTAEGSRFSSRIERNTPNKGGITLKIQGVDDRNTAESLRGAEFVIDESEVGQLPDGSFYLYKLIGLKVVTEDGRELGEIVQILQGGGNDVYETDTGLLIPAIKQIVVKIDTDANLMVIRPMPGLLPE